MNDTELRTAARERLELAELTEALGASRPLLADTPAPTTPTKRTAWFALVAAAAALAVTIWIATGYGKDDDSETQDPGPLDPVAPFYERFFPYFQDFARVKETDEARFLPRNDIRLFVCTDILAEEWLQQLMGSPDLAQLHISRRYRDNSEHFLTDEPEIWRQWAKASNLESLLLWNLPTIDATHVRELRACKKLTHISLNLSKPIDATIATALTELPTLRALEFMQCTLSPEAAQILAKAPKLERLSLEHLNGDTKELGAALARFPHLRSLRITDYMTPGWQDVSFLAEMDRLQVLELAELPRGDEDLAMLPTSLESFSLSDGHKASENGVRSLKRLTKLRSLAVVYVPPKSYDALAEVVQNVPLERFDWHGKLTPALWRSLSLRDHMRSLALDLKAEHLVRDLARLRHMQRLEHLTLRCSKTPTPESLQDLRKFPKLRVVRLEIGEDLKTRRGKPTKAAIALRDCLGSDIDLQIR